jgi:hypothetical protein
MCLPVQSIIINEGIKSFGFIFYMAFIVEGRTKMVLAFQVEFITFEAEHDYEYRDRSTLTLLQHLFPKLKVLLPIYRGTRAVMLGEPE